MFPTLCAVLTLALMPACLQAQRFLAGNDVLPDAPEPRAALAQDTHEANTSSSSASLAPQQSERERAEAQVRKQENQRIMGVVPNFNIAYDADVPPLRPGQKFRLAFRSAVDPFAFLAAALDAAISQATNDYAGYHQGWVGYAKRVGASYADNFNGTIIGNAIYPILLKEDPRYFRKGTGTVKRRMLYAIETSVWSKRDGGGWGPNYANVLGNITAGGIANFYYPSTDRGVGLTFERAFTVTAEGTIGALANEFLPDITEHVLHRDISGRRTTKRP